MNGKNRFLAFLNINKAILCHRLVDYYYINKQLPKLREMKINKLIMVAGLLMAIGGLTFTLLPHNMHYLITGAVTFGNYEISHGEHETGGYLFSLIGVLAALIGWIIK